MQKTSTMPDTGTERPGTPGPRTAPPRLRGGWRAFFVCAGAFMALYSGCALLVLADYIARSLEAGEACFIASAGLSSALVALSALNSASFLHTTADSRAQMARNIASSALVAVLAVATMHSIGEVPTSRIYDGWEGLGVALGAVMLVYALTAVALLAVVTAVRLSFAPRSPGRDGGGLPGSPGGSRPPTPREGASASPRAAERDSRDG